MTERTQAGTENRTSCKITSNQETSGQENKAESMEEYYLLSLQGLCTDSECPYSAKDHLTTECTAHSGQGPSYIN